MGNGDLIIESAWGLTERAFSKFASRVCYEHKIRKTLKYLTIYGRIKCLVKIFLGLAIDPAWPFLRL
jgi:hypothetical protein